MKQSVRAFFSITILFGVINIISCTGEAGDAQPDESAARAYERARELNRQGNLPEAINQFSKAIAIDSNYKEPYFNRGAAYLMIKRPDLAEQDLTSYISLDSGSADAFNLRGLARSYMGMGYRAIYDFSQALRLDSSFAEAYLNRASVYNEIGEGAKAIADFDKAEKLQPDNPEIYYQKGLYYYRNSEYDRALEQYERSISLGLDRPQVHQSIANAYFRKGDFEKAIEKFNYVLELEPENIAALGNRAVLFDTLGMESKAEADRAKLEELMEKSDIKKKDYTPVEELDYKIYASDNGVFTILLPSSWNVFKSKAGNISKMIVAKDSISSIDEPYTTGVHMAFNKNMAQEYSQESVEGMIDFWQGSVAKNAQEYYDYSLFERKTFYRNGYSGMRNYVEMQITPNSPLLKAYEVALAKGDNLFYAYFQCPSSEWGYYKQIFDKALESLVMKE